MKAPIRNLAVISCLTAVISAIVCFAVIKTADRELKQTYRKNMMEMSPAFADAISLWNGTIASKMALYTESDIVKTGTTAQIISWLSNIKERRPDGLAYILFVDSNGTAWSDNGTCTNVADRPFFKAVMHDGNDTYIDSPVTSRITGELVYHICVAAYNGKKEKIGLFAGDVFLDALQKVIETDMEGQSGFISITDEHGKCIINHDPRFRMQDMKDDPEPGASEIVQAMLAHESGMGIIQTAYMGTADAFYTPIKGCGWEFMFLVPEKTMTASLRPIIFILIIGSILLIISEILIFMLFMHKNQDNQY